MTVSDDQQAVIQFLSRPEHYGLPGAKIERIETHGAIVFLVGERAYKLKRAVKYPYMDYSTPEKRKAMCERELEVNRRLAPAIYLEVRSILQGVDGELRFGPDEAAAARDHVVVMRRFDQANLFGHLCDDGKLTPELMRALAETVARFHASAQVTPDFGGADAIAQVIHETEAELSSMIDAPFARADVERYLDASTLALRQLGPVLEARRDNGHVRRCHGDLHLDNAVLLKGKPTLFDAIEFEDAFACIDVFYDLAFLVMDLLHHGARGLAQALLNRYLECTGDYEALALLPLFLACRAGIRAHVSVSRARAKGGDDTALAEARAYLALAQDCLSPLRPRLVAIGGLSGTGKSTIARLVAPKIGAAPGAVILRSDVTRKRLMGVSETTRLPESAYTPDMNARVFHAMAELAGHVLACGHSVIMDAVYGTHDERVEIEAVARLADARFDGLWLEAGAHLLMSRIAGRSGDASDATEAVLKKQIATIMAPSGWTRIDAAPAPERIAETVLNHLIKVPER